MNSDSRIALVDLDGTVADYDAAMERDLTPLRSPDETGPVVIHGKGDWPDHYRARVDLIRNRAGWWRNLGRLVDGFRVVDMMRRIGFEIHVLTKGPKKSTNAWTEKVEWCHENMPDDLVTISSDKSMVYGRALMDDWPPYVAAWLKARPRALVIMPDRPWNQGYEHPRVIRYTGENDDIVFAALQLAFLRRDGIHPQRTCDYNGCDGVLHRWKQPPLPKEWIDSGGSDCRDYLPSLRVACDKCGEKRKKRHAFVPGSWISCDDFCVLQDEHGWPVPERLFPPIPDETAAKLAELRGE
jgi:5'-nucleotidase